MFTRVMASSEAIVARLRAAGCVFAADEAALLSEAAGSPDELESMVAARVGGLPLEQVVGWAEFRGLRILVDPGVFVPRRRSEFLVETALALTTSPGDTGTPPATNPARLTDPRPARSWVNSEPMMSLLTHDHESRGTTPSGEPDISGISRATAPVVVDLCCGSGALGVAAAAGLASAELHAADLDPAAVACARTVTAPTPRFPPTALRTTARWAGSISSARSRSVRRGPVRAASGSSSQPPRPAGAGRPLDLQCSVRAD